MPTYTEIARPSTTYEEIGTAMYLLLINSSDFLLINASDDKLGISTYAETMYTEITRPS